MRFIRRDLFEVLQDNYSMDLQTDSSARALGISESTKNCPNQIFLEVAQQEPNNLTVLLLHKLNKDMLEINDKNSTKETDLLSCSVGSQKAIREEHSKEVLAHAEDLLSMEGRSREMSRSDFGKVVFSGSLQLEEKTFDLKVNDSLYKLKYKKHIVNSSDSFHGRDDLFNFFRNYTISDAERKHLWKVRIGNSLKIDMRLFKSLKERLKIEGVSLSTERIIKNDMSRTVPHYKETAAGKYMYENIKELLSLFSLYRPDIGYVQGMSFLIVVLYYYYEEFECFVLFANLIITKRLIMTCYDFDIDRIMTYKSIFNNKIKRKCPKVQKLLEVSGINTEAFLLDWLYTLFSRAVNIKMVRIFWDIFLIFGDYYLLRVAYSIFGLLKRELAQKKYMEDGLKFIRSKANTLRVSKLMQHTLREVKTANEIDKLMLKHFKKVVAEKEQENRPQKK